MPNYVRQHDEFRCGPIAILNALKWARCGVSSALIPRLCKEVSCDPRGTTQKNLNRGLTRRGKGIFFTRQDFDPSLTEIERRLRLGEAVILCYWYYVEKPPGRFGRLLGHYALIVDVSRSGSTFSVVNYFAPDNTQRQRISRRTLRNNLMSRRERWWYHARAWYLRARSC